MPELPEVETIRRGLESHLTGTRIDTVTVLSARAVRRDGGPAPIKTTLEGATVKEVARRGKYLWLVTAELEAVVVHLGMSGQLLQHTHAPAPLRHEAVRLTHSNGTLVFVDQRTFGYMHAARLVPTSDGAAGGTGTKHALVPESVSHIARDPLDPAVSLPDVAERMMRSHSAIKRVLLDQRFVSGIGNIYADESLWRAKVHPLEPASHVGHTRMTQLLQVAREVMTQAVAVGGTSFDQLYVNTQGESGYFARELAAYGRAGQECLRCGDTIHRLVVGGRSSNVCLTCQEFVEGTA